MQAPPTTSPSPENDSSSDSHHLTPSPIDQNAPESGVSMTSVGTPQDLLPQEPNANPPSDLSRKLSKRKKPIQFPPAAGYISSPEKNRGIGVFGRMAKRFSFGMGNFMSGGKRGMVFERRQGYKGSMSLTDVNVLSNGPLGAPQNDPPLTVRNNPPQQESKKQGPKRVPPPSLDETASPGLTATSQADIDSAISKSVPDTTSGPSAAPQLPSIVSDSSFGLLSHFQKGAVRDSLVSTDAEPDWSLGKLTIANPDMAGASDTDTSLRGRERNRSLPSHPQGRVSPIDPDPRASIRAEVNSRSSVQDLDVRTVTSESFTPVQAPVSLQQQEPERLVPPPPPKERSSLTVSETATTQDLRISTTESSVTTTSRPSSHVSSQDLPPTPEDLPTPQLTRSNTLPPPPPPSKITKNPQTDVSVQAQNGQLNGRLVSDTSNLPPSTEIPSPTKPRLNGRQEHIYIVDVPVEGSLFVRSSSDGTSVPPVEKPELPPLPPKPKPPPLENTSNHPSNSSPSVRQQKERKETTIFTSLFTTPRPRRTSETSPHGGSPYDRDPKASSSSTSKRTKISPDKSFSTATHTHTRTISGSPEKEPHRERTKDRDHYGSRRGGDRRSYVERRGDSEGDSGDKRRELGQDSARPSSKESHVDKTPRSRDIEAERDLERERGREHRQAKAKEDERERGRKPSQGGEERSARAKREREDDERRVRREKEREEEERREKKAHEREEERRRLKRAKEKEEEERKAKEDEERRIRKIKEREAEERRVRREKERAEEEKRVKREREREREDQERKIRKAREEEERRFAEEEERSRKKRMRIEEERLLKKEEEERRLRDEERRARKEEEERKARKEEDERRARREEEERRARREEEERKVKREEERARREEEERIKKEEERRARIEEEERRFRKQEEERRARLEEEERRVRKQEEKEELARATRKENERLEAVRKAQEVERKERERKERKFREDQQRRDKERERELLRQREMEMEQKHQAESSWSQTRRSLRSTSEVRPTTSMVGSNYDSEYSSYTGYNWEPMERLHAKKRSYDIHESGKQARNHKEPIKLPDYNRRVELGIYPPESSSHRRRPRAVSLESAPSQPPTPPYKDKEYTLRRRQISGHLHPSFTVDDPTFIRSRAPPRPVSGFPSPDVFKASEAWEHERFWKGQSMNFDFDSNSAMSGSLPPVSWSDVHSYAYEAGIPSASYYSPPVPPPGSSYTSFVVQPPSWGYPPYQPTASLAPIEPFTIPSSSNPLPPPPRQSSYHNLSSS